jgi:hypothetical protein
MSHLLQHSSGHLYVTPEHFRDFRKARMVVTMAQHHGHTGWAWCLMREVDRTVDAKDV